MHAAGVTDDRTSAESLAGVQCRHERDKLAGPDGPTDGRPNTGFYRPVAGSTQILVQNLVQPPAGLLPSPIHTRDSATDGTANFNLRFIFGH